MKMSRKGRFKYYFWTALNYWFLIWILAERVFKCLVEIFLLKWKISFFVQELLVKCHHYKIARPDYTTSYPPEVRIGFWNCIECEKKIGGWGEGGGPPIVTVNDCGVSRVGMGGSITQDERDGFNVINRSCLSHSLSLSHTLTHTCLHTFTFPK